MQLPLKEPETEHREITNGNNGSLNIDDFEGLLLLADRLREKASECQNRLFLLRMAFFAFIGVGFVLEVIVWSLMQGLGFGQAGSTFLGLILLFIFAIICFLIVKELKRVREEKLYGYEHSLYEVVHYLHEAKSFVHDLCKVHAQRILKNKKLLATFSLGSKDDGLFGLRKPPTR